MLVIALAPPGGTFEYEAGAPVMSNTQLLMSIEHIADRKMWEGPLYIGIISATTAHEREVLVIPMSVLYASYVITCNRGICSLCSEVEREWLENPDATLFR